MNRIERYDCVQDIAATLHQIYVELTAFERWLIALEGSANNHAKMLVITGDFNAKSGRWGRYKMIEERTWLWNGLPRRG